LVALGEDALHCVLPNGNGSDRHYAAHEVELLAVREEFEALYAAGCGSIAGACGRSTEEYSACAPICSRQELERLDLGRPHRSEMTLVERRHL
jgi:hypothetical protein